MPVRVTGWNLATAIAQIEVRIELLLAKIAHDVEAWAKLNAPVDTGFLRGSIRARHAGEFYWVVAVGAEYGAYVELGTVNIAAHPYLLPALLTVTSRIGTAADNVNLSGPAEP
jgi:hypothetical protein